MLQKYKIFYIFANYLRKNLSNVSRKVSKEVQNHKIIHKIQVDFESSVDSCNPSGVVNHLRTRVPEHEQLCVGAYR